MPVPTRRPTAASAATAYCMRVVSATDTPRSAQRQQDDAAHAPAIDDGRRERADQSEERELSRRNEAGSLRRSGRPGRVDRGRFRSIRSLRAVENGPSAARLTLRRRLGVCRTPVKHRFGYEVTRPPGDESAPPPMGPAAGPFFACAVTTLTRRPDPTSSRPRRSSTRSCAPRAAARPLRRRSGRSWLARPMERAEAAAIRSGPR